MHCKKRIFKIIVDKRSGKRDTHKPTKFWGNLKKSNYEKFCVHSFISSW